MYRPKQCICFKMEIAQSDHRLCKCLIFFEMGDSMTHVFLVKSHRANYYIFTIVPPPELKARTLQIGLVGPDQSFEDFSGSSSLSWGSKQNMYTNKHDAIFD